MSARRVFWIFVGVAILVGVAFVPITSLSSPVWDVSVTDQGGHPISSTTVRLAYRNYSAESQSHEINETTDGHGHVTFSPQTVSAYRLRTSENGASLPLTKPAAKDCTDASKKKCATSVKNAQEIGVGDAIEFEKPLRQ